MKTEGNAELASPRPWRIARVTRDGGAVVKGADEAVVAVVNADNAALIVRAVNGEKTGD